MSNFYVSPVPQQPPPAPPLVPPRPTRMCTATASSASSGTSSNSSGVGQSQGPSQKKSVSSSASAFSGLYEERAPDLGPRANETRDALRSLYLYDQNTDGYETPTDEIADTICASERSARVFGTRFVEACEKGFRALRYCSLAARHLQSLFSCDPNAEDVGARVLACVNETLAEASGLGLPEEILQLIDSCKIVFKERCNAAKWFVKSLQSERALLVEKSLPSPVSPAPKPQLQQGPSKPGAGASEAAVLSLSRPCSALSNSTSVASAPSQQQFDAPRPRQVQPLFPDGLPGIMNLPSMPQQTDDVIYDRFTKFLYELNKALDKLKCQTKQVVDIRTEFMQIPWYRQRMMCELHERSLLPQQQFTQSRYELQRCRLERQALEQCKPCELGVKEATRDQLIEGLRKLLVDFSTSTFGSAYYMVKEAITKWKKVQQVADFKAETERGKGRRELLNSLDRIAPFCEALIDVLLQLNTDIAEFFRCYFISNDSQGCQVLRDGDSDSEKCLKFEIESFNERAKKWFTELLELAMVIECQPVPSKADPKTVRQLVPQANTTGDMTTISRKKRTSPKDKEKEQRPDLLENTPQGDTMDGSADSDDESDDEDPRLLNVRSVFQKGVAISARLRWLVSGSFMENLKNWHRSAAKHSTIPVYARLLRAKPVEEQSIETNGNEQIKQYTVLHFQPVQISVANAAGVEDQFRSMMLTTTQLASVSANKGKRLTSKRKKGDAEKGGDETSVYESMPNGQQNAAPAHPLDRSVFSISAFHSYLKKGSSLSVRLEKLNVGGKFPFAQDYLAIYKDLNVPDPKEPKRKKENGKTIKVADIRNCLSFECNIYVSWDNLVSKDAPPTKLSYHVFSNPIVITSHTKYFREAHPTTFWDNHFGQWVPRNSFLSGLCIAPRHSSTNSLNGSDATPQSGLSTSDQAAANQMPQYKVRTHVTWQELVEAMDLWFLSKTGRGFFDPHPHSSAYSRPKIEDYLTSRFFNEYSDQANKEGKRERRTKNGFYNIKKTELVSFQDACREVLQDGPEQVREKQEQVKQETNAPKNSDSSDDESARKKKKKDEKKKIFSFFEWMNAILALIAKNKYHRTIWINGQLHGFMSKSDSFEMLKDRRVKLRTFIVRFSHSLLGSVAISYGYDYNNTLNHLENAGPWDEEDFEMVCLKRRITDVSHGLLYIYPNILLSGWEYLPEDQKIYLKNKEERVIDEEAHIYEFYNMPKVIMEPLVKTSYSRNRNASINSVMSPRVELAKSDIDIKSEALSPAAQSDSGPMLQEGGGPFMAPLEFSGMAAGVTFTPQLSSSASSMAPINLTSSQLSNPRAAAGGGFMNLTTGGARVSLSQSQGHAKGFNFPTYSTPSNPIFVPAASAQFPISEHIYSNPNTLEANAQSPQFAFRPIMQLQQWGGLGQEANVGQPSEEMVSNFDTEIDDLMGMVNPLMAFGTSVPQHTQTYSNFYLPESFAPGGGERCSPASMQQLSQPMGSVQMGDRATTVSQQQQQQWDVNAFHHTYAEPTNYVPLPHVNFLIQSSDQQ